MGLLALAGFVVRFYYLQFYDVISADGVSYVTIARDFIAGRGLGSALHYPPFYPILLGLASTVFHDFETAGLAVSIVMGSLLVVPVYLLGAEFFDKRVGTAAAFLSVTWPPLRYWSTAVMSQATYITLLLMAIYCLWIAYRKGAVVPSVLAGAFFAAAHLTRSEAVLVFAAEIGVLVLMTLVQKQPARKLGYLVMSAGVFFLLFSPYLVLLHDLTGKWQLTGKSKIAIADALSEYLGRPDLKHDPSFQELGYLDLFRLYPEYIRTNYLKNLAVCWRDMLPLYGWLLAAVGLVAGAWNREKIFERLYLLASFSPLAIIVVFFFVGPEYTQAYLPVLFLFLVNALVVMAAWGVARSGGDEAAGWRRYLGYLPLALALLYGTWNVLQGVPADRDKPYHYERDGGRLDEKHIGQRLKKELPANAVMITRSGRIGFYSERKYLLPPQTDYSGLLKFAKESKVDYLIATPQLLNMRPQLEFLFTPILDPGVPFTPPPELELVAVAQEPGGLPYIVYRFR